MLLLYFYYYWFVYSLGWNNWDNGLIKPILSVILSFIIQFNQIFTFLSVTQVKYSLFLGYLFFQLVVNSLPPLVYYTVVMSESLYFINPYYHSVPWININLLPLVIFSSLFPRFPISLTRFSSFNNQCTWIITIFPYLLYIILWVFILFLQFIDPFPP